MLSQYEYTVEYRKTSDHGNADALSLLPAGPDSCFNGEESKADTDCICSIKTIGLQLNPGDPSVLPKETAKDRVLATVVRYTREGWPLGKIREENNDTGHTAYTVEAFRKIRDSLSVSNGCHVAYETLGKNGSLLARDRFLYCGSQSDISSLC